MVVHGWPMAGSRLHLVWLFLDMAGPDWTWLDLMAGYGWTRLDLTGLDWTWLD